jgi:hypothetical protein
MQDKKEHFKVFMKTTKEKVRDWGFRHLLVARFLEYFLFVVLFSFAAGLSFTLFDLFHTDVDSARYMLSALVQSQAAIIAIVISLTLIAVQLTASAYSPRVIRIFLKNPDMWLLLAFFGVSISYGLLVLKMIRGEDLRDILLFGYLLEYHIVSVYLYGGITFLMLFFYTRNIINLLNPSTIINRLANEITKDKILNPNEDPVQPIVDIIHGSIMKYDLETTRVGLKAVTDRVIKIIDSDGEKEISRHFCSHLERVGRLSISREDVESTEKVIEHLEIFGKSTAKKGLKTATGRVVVSLERVGRAAAEKGLGDATRQVARSLGEVGRAAAENGLEDATWDAAEFLEAVGKIAMKKGLGGAAFEVIESLGSVGQIAAEKGLETATGRVVKALLAVRQNLEKVVASNLAGLTLLNGEIVKTAIQKYKSELKEQDRDSFQKFKKLYEQELEKLQVEK